MPASPTDKRPSLAALIHSALAVEAMAPADFRNIADLTPEERERGEAWRRFRDQPGPPTAAV
jgi:hypothetical protein